MLASRLLIDRPKKNNTRVLIRFSRVCPTDARTGATSFRMKKEAPVFKHQSLLNNSNLELPVSEEAAWAAWTNFAGR